MTLKRMERLYSPVKEFVSNEDKGGCSSVHV